MIVLSLPKAKEKILRKLDQKKQRRDLGLFIAEGFRLVNQIFESTPNEIEFLVINNVKDDSFQSSFLHFDKPIYTCDQEQFESFSNTDSSQGIIAVCNIPKPITQTDIESKNFILCLDSIQDPGNLGTIIRNSFWYGVDALVLGKGTVDLFNKKVVRSSMSNICELVYYETDLSDFLEKQSSNFNIYSFALDDNAEDIRSLNMNKKSILLIGNEGNGIQHKLLEFSSNIVFIPSFFHHSNRVESLNAGIASAIALHTYRLTHNT